MLCPFLSCCVPRGYVGGCFDTRDRSQSARIVVGHKGLMTSNSMTSNWQCLHHSGSTGVHGMCHAIVTAHIMVVCCHERMFIDEENLFIQKKSDLWACIALRISPTMFFTWILCLILSQATMSSSSSVLMFVPVGQTVCPILGLLSYSPKGEGNKTHHIKVTSFVHKKRKVQAQPRRPLPQQGINSGDNAKSVSSGWLYRTLAQNHSHDLTSVFGVVVPPKLKADAMLLSCNAY